MKDSSRERRKHDHQRIPVTIYAFLPVTAMSDRKFKAAYQFLMFQDGPVGWTIRLA